MSDYEFGDTPEDVAYEGSILPGAAGGWLISWYDADMTAAASLAKAKAYVRATAVGPVRFRRGKRNPDVWHFYMDQEARDDSRV